MLRPPPVSPPFPSTPLFRSWVMELAGHVGRRAFRYVDAPVTGLPAAAAAGALTMLVGADEADLEHARPLFKSEEHTSELQSRRDLVCRLLLEKKKKKHRKTR